MARESVYIWGQSADGNSKRRRPGSPGIATLDLVGAGAYIVPSRPVAEWHAEMQISYAVDSASGPRI